MEKSKSIIKIYFKNSEKVYEYSSYNELYNDIKNKLYDKKDILSAFAVCKINLRSQEDFFTTESLPEYKYNIFLYNCYSIISRPELYIKYYKENPEIYDQSLLTEDIIKIIYFLNTN
jgi:hypothetical protein